MGQIMNKQFFKIFLLALTSLPITSQSLELKGVGRRVSVQIFDEWAKQFSAQNSGTTIKYEANNTIEGPNQVVLGTADFGDTDVPFTKKELEQKGLTQFPYMFTATTPVFNLPNLFDGQIKLDGKTLGDIFLGKITKWNDPAITATNPRVQLPNEKILLAYVAANGSGTYPLSNYLSKVNPDWKSKMGVGTKFNWPTGVAVENMYAMGEYIKKTPYSIGYSEIAYARKNKLSYVQLQNKEGKFVSPHTGSIEDAVHNVKWNASNGFCEELTYEIGAGSWPITSASYLVIKNTSDNIERRQELLKFLGWGLRLGDMVVSNLDFMPIKRSILPLIRNSWNDTPLNIEGGEVVSAKQALELASNGVPIIDARVAAEYEEAHIANAISVPYAEKSKKETNFNPASDHFDLTRLPANKNAGLVFYCNAGSCWKGYKAAVVAINAGYKKVYWLRGGIPEWQEKNYPVVSNSHSPKQLVAQNK